MRAFLALDLSKETKAAVAAVQAKLKTETIHVKWVDPEQMHLTLRFFVDLQPEQQQRLATTMMDVVKRLASFTYKVRGVGFFASGAARWIGVGD